MSEAKNEIRLDALVMPSDEQVKDLDHLLPEEVSDIQSLYLSWQAARKRKDWGLADYYRDRFAWWDSSLGTDGIWFPIFEINLNRMRRAFMRMKRYKVDIYPWSMDMAA